VPAVVITAIVETTTAEAVTISLITRKKYKPKQQFCRIHFSYIKVGVTAPSKMQQFRHQIQGLTFECNCCLGLFNHFGSSSVAGCIRLTSACTRASSN
jgi:hypothetical protein